MEQGERSRKGKHLTREERIVIERMSRGGIPPRDIAACSKVNSAVFIACSLQPASLLSISG